jgi:hypothetical protein
LLRLVTISKKYENASDLYKVLHNIELRILREDWNKLKNHAIQKKMEDDLNNVNKKEIINVANDFNSFLENAIGIFQF